jgi:hypothetical protein
MIDISARLQEQIASIMAGAGLVWAAKVGTASRLGIAALVNTPGVVELLCISILMWLIAKWRAVRPMPAPVQVQQSAAE